MGHRHGQATGHIQEAPGRHLLRGVCAGWRDAQRRRADGSLGLWDLNPHERLATFQAHAGGTLSVAFGPDSKTLASVSEDGTVKLWHALTGQALATLSGHADWDPRWHLRRMAKRSPRAATTRRSDCIPRRHSKRWNGSRPDEDRHVRGTLRETPQARRLRHVEAIPAPWPRHLLDCVSKFNIDFATTGYATPWGDQRGELRLSPLETPSLRSPRQDPGE